jgi:sugar/nucleoside kinase (ribokinase family)
MNGRRIASSKAQFDYTTVGHVTADVTADGSLRPGGSAFYSALQAARLGKRALIVTQGKRREIEELLEPFRSEVELEILPAGQTTTLQTCVSDGLRRQRVLRWAGPIADDLPVRTAILHLAPVARETPRRWQGRAQFVGLTPQGLVREWDEESGDIVLAPAPAAASELASVCDAMVMSNDERMSCATLIARAREAGAVVAVTAGASPTAVLAPGRRAAQVAVPAVEDPKDDVGAGDVFAAAFFVMLEQGRPPAFAAAFANAAAAVRMAGEGARAVGETSAIEARLGRAGPQRDRATRRPSESGSSA